MAADIRATPHNLARHRTSAEADEVCVFCHTPQLRPGEATAGVRPVWQPSLAATHDFLMFDDIGRKQYGKQAVGSQSIACLSCHDASQAFEVTASMSEHPFGVPYRGFSGGQGKVEAEREKFREEEDKQAFRPAVAVKADDDFRMPSRGMIENRTIWWVSSRGVRAVRTRSDLPLYARQNEDGDEIPYIECSSCHDPHVARPLFLRVGNEGSKLCLTCHDK